MQPNTAHTRHRIGNIILSGQLQLKPLRWYERIALYLRTSATFDPKHRRLIWTDPDVGPQR